VVPKPILLRVEDLKVEFDTPAGRLRAVDGVNLAIAPGEILGLVGESGSGKTVFALSLLGLIDPPGSVSGGKIFYRETELTSMSEAQILPFRGRQISMIFQNPSASLNPRILVGKQLTSVIRLHFPLTQKEATTKAEQWLREVQVGDASRVMNSFPHELSGGMCQRVMIAMALACNPGLLVADEPTASLDVTIQAEIVNLLLTLRERHGMAILFICHDLGVVARLCDRVAVMYLGRIVETAPAVQLYQDPSHPYTRALISCIPTIGKREHSGTVLVRGESPSSLAIPRNSCRFRARCPEAIAACSQKDPQLQFMSEDRAVACILRTASELRENV